MNLSLLHHRSTPSVFTALFPGLTLLFFTIMIVTPLAAQRPAPSWRDLGTAQLAEGKLDSAEYYLARWVEADPRDASSWYNLACVRALQGKSERALDAWEMSVAAGWDDADHPLKDGDLTSIRENPRFTAALAKVSENQKGNGPKNFVRRFLEVSTVGTYIVLLPEDYATSGKSYPLCLILHGSGSSELGHGRLADAFGRDDVIYVVPRALNAKPLSSSEVGYSAWPDESIDSLSPLYTMPAINYAAWIMACADDVRKNYRVDNQKVMVLGHSQGAAFAWVVAALYPEKISSIYSYAGYFMDDYTTDEILNHVRDAKIDITLAHGLADGTVNPQETREFDSLLTAHGIPHTTHYFDGVSHFIMPEVMESMKGWVGRGGKVN